MYTRDLTTVTNIYPVFVKSMAESERGIYLSKILSEIKKDNYTSFKKYMYDYNVTLNEFILDCYNQAYETDDYYTYEGHGANEHVRFYKIDNDYYLMILHVYPYTILLNYEKVDDTDDIIKIPSIRDYNIHVREYKQNNNIYKVTNTYNAFLNYTSMNGLPLIKDSNDPFFECFFDSVNEVDLSKNYGAIRHTLDVKRPKNGDNYNHFSYIIEEDKDNDIVIIVDYYSSSIHMKKGRFD